MFTGNAVVIWNRKEYVCKIKSIQNDRLKFKKVYKDHDKTLNYLIHNKNRVIDALKNLRDKRDIFFDQYKDLIQSSSRPGIVYGLAEVHKIASDSLQSFRLLDLFCQPSVHRHTNL